MKKIIIGGLSLLLLIVSCVSVPEPNEPSQIIKNKIFAFDF